MLVIARKPGERICLGDDITVTVLEINGSSVRLGLEAPREVQIFRHEIWLAIKAENQAAARAGAEEVPATKGGSN